jgi:hypothetical protein
MNKKGVELTVNTVIIVALGLLVLFIMFFVLQKNLIGGSEKYLNFSLETERELRAGDICQKIFSDRVCMKTCTGYQELPGPWKDCKGDKLKCCLTTKKIP